MDEIDSRKRLTKGENSKEKSITKNTAAGILARNRKFSISATSKYQLHETDQELNHIPTKATKMKTVSKPIYSAFEL